MSSKSPEETVSSIGAAAAATNRFLSEYDEITAGEANERPSMSGEELSQESTDLIDSVRQQYDFSSVLFSMEERTAFVKEFLLILREVKYRSQFFHSHAVSYFISHFKCN